MGNASLFREEIVKAISTAGLEEKIVEEILEVPSRKELGDFALPCFKLAKELGKNPVEISHELQKKIVLPKGFSRAEVKGAYINFFLDEWRLAQQVIQEINTKKQKYGIEKQKGRRVIVEYCQANPMKAFHVGHVRNIVLGEAIARLFEASGKNVYRMNYGGDVGTHVSKTLYSYQELKHRPEPKGIVEKGKWLGEIYSAGAKAVRENEVLEQKMRDMVVALEKKDKKLVPAWKKLRKISLKYFDSIYKELGVKFGRVIMESEVEKEGIKIAQSLLEQKIAVKDKGAVLVDLTEHSLGKFLILKSDGAALYSSKDLALAKLKKKEYGAEKSYYVVGAEQAFYFRQLGKTIELLNERKNEYSPVTHISYELVRLEGGKMSSREGNVITYDELLETVLEKTIAETRQRHPEWPKKKLSGVARRIAFAAIKFGMLSHDRNSVITFNWEKATSLEGETGPFILYSYARANSILRKAGKAAKMKPGKLELGHDKEKQLVSMLSEFKQKVKEAAEQNSPHKIAYFLMGLSQEFNSFYHEVPVLQAEGDKKLGRLELVKAVVQVLENGLGMLNIAPTEEM